MYDHQNPHCKRWTYDMGDEVVTRHKWHPMPKEEMQAFHVSYILTQLTIDRIPREFFSLPLSALFPSVTRRSSIPTYSESEGLVQFTLVIFQATCGWNNSVNFEIISAVIPSRCWHPRMMVYFTHWTWVRCLLRMVDHSNTCDQLNYRALKDIIN